MTKSPQSDSREMLAEQLNAILGRYAENSKEADQSICELLDIALPEDGVLYVDDMFGSIRKAGLRIQFELLKPDGALSGEDDANVG